MSNNNNDNPYQSESAASDNTSDSCRRYVMTVVERYIDKHKLLDKKNKYLTALSGGADSVALLRIMLQLGYDVEAVHCNFHLRGAESDRDEQFVSSLCEKHDVVLHIAHFDTFAYAELHKVSIEMAARDLRYNYFEQLRKDVNAAAICVAHHRDDSVETVLMNIIRGTGIKGLTGINPRNGNILRPLLCISRNDVENYLLSLNQDYVTDSTNLKDDVVRNKIRLDVLPLLKTINPAVSENVQKVSERVSDLLPLLERSADEAKRRVIKREKPEVIISISALMSEPSPEYILFSILGGYGFSSSVIEQIFLSVDSAPGKIFSSSEKDLLIDRDCMIIDDKVADFRNITIPEEGTYVCDDGSRLRVGRQVKDADFVVSREKGCVCLDADKVRFPLTLRRVSQGDRFVPFGMKGKKLLSDYMTDTKMSLFGKRRQLVLADAEGKIIWLVDERPDDRCRITPSTTDILRISYE